MAGHQCPQPHHRGADPGQTCLDAELDGLVSEFTVRDSTIDAGGGSDRVEPREPAVLTFRDSLLDVPGTGVLATATQGGTFAGLRLENVTYGPRTTRGLSFSGVTDVSVNGTPFG